MTWGEIIAIGVGVAVVAFLIILRVRAKSPWLGPLYWYELVRLARRGGQPKLRAFYAILLLIGLLVLYLRVFDDVDPATLLFNSSIQLPQSKRETLTEWFTYIFFAIQVVMVSLITPVYAGGAIAEEKDRKTLEYLQTAMLSDREIVLGKLAARLTFVTLIVLVGMPILFMVTLFGGLNPTTMIQCFTVTIFTMFGLAGFSLLMGVYRKSLRDALYWPYGLLIIGTIVGFMMCCCPVPGLQALSPISTLWAIFAWNAQGGAFGTAFGFSPDTMTYVLLGIFCLIYGLTFLICTAIAIMGIRPKVYRASFDPDTGRRRGVREQAVAAVPKPTKRATVIASWPSDAGSELPKLDDVKSVDEPPPLPNVEEPPPLPQPTAARVLAKPVNDRQVTDKDDTDDEEEWPKRRRRPRIVVAKRTFRVMPLRDQDPYLWKEKYFGGRLPVLESGVTWGCLIAVIAVFLSIIGIGLFSGILIMFAEREYPSKVINFFLKFYVCGVIIGLSPVVGLRAAGMVSRERQQQTLLSLLTIPEARSRILGAKWLAPILGVKWWLISLFIAIIVALFTGGLHPLGAVSGLLYLVGFMLFANSLGLWLSVRTTSSLRAITTFFSVLLALVIGPPIFSTLVRAVFRMISNNDPFFLFFQEFVDHLNPVYGVVRSLVGWDGTSGSSSSDEAVWATLLTTSMIGAIYGFMAVILTWLSFRRFEKETV